MELVGARSDNGYLLYDKEYKASTSFAIKTKLITHHYIEGTTTKVHEDQVEEYAFASVYLSKSLSSNELEGEYKNKYHVNDNVVSNASGIMNKNLVEVTYYYTINKYNINVRNIGGVGTVTGSEEVVHGNDSKENNIVITPSNGYGISKILVDGKEVTITNNLGMTLENFKNVQEDHTVEVEFKELKAPTPITGKQVSYILIAIALLTIAACAFMIYRKNLKR